MVDASHRFFTQAYQTLAYAARDYASRAPSVLCALRFSVVAAGALAHGPGAS